MAFTEEEEKRIELIESTLNKIMVWLGNTYSKKVGRQIILNQQETIDNLSTRLAAAESQLTTIITRLDSLSD